MTQSSPVDVLLADCARVTEAIAGHKAAVAGLTAERDAMVVQLRALGLSERAVGRLLGISGPRVNQITRPDRPAASLPGQPAVMVADEPLRRGSAVMVSGAGLVPVPGPPEREPVPAKQPRCTHPGTRVIGGYCKICQVIVEHGGWLPGGWVRPEGWKP